MRDCCDLRVLRREEIYPGIRAPGRRGNDSVTKQWPVEWRARRRESSLTAAFFWCMSNGLSSRFIGCTSISELNVLLYAVSFPSSSLWSMSRRHSSMVGRWVAGCTCICIRLIPPWPGQCWPMAAKSDKFPPQWPFLIYFVHFYLFNRSFDQKALEQSSLNRRNHETTESTEPTSTSQERNSNHERPPI